MDKKNGTIHATGRCTCLIHVDNGESYSMGGEDEHRVIWFESADGTCTPKYYFKRAPKWLINLYNQRE